jgi:hypothetical protein
VKPPLACEHAAGAVKVVVMAKADAACASLVAAAAVSVVDVIATDAITAVFASTLSSLEIWQLRTALEREAAIVYKKSKETVIRVSAGQRMQIIDVFSPADCHTSPHSKRSARQRGGV